MEARLQVPAKDWLKVGMDYI